MMTTKSAAPLQRARTPGARRVAWLLLGVWLPVGRAAQPKPARAEDLGLRLERDACARVQRFGHAGDGGWDVCADALDRPAAPNQPGCLVYSAGTFDDPSFDIAIAAAGCAVHAFDPTLEQQGFGATAASLGQNSNVTFHAIGFGGRDLIHPPGTAPWQYPGLGYGRFSNAKPWELRTLPDLMRALNHTDATLAALKMDIEGGEWAVLESLLADPASRARLGAGALFRQLLIEIHLLPDADEYERFVALSAPAPSTLQLYLAKFGLARDVAPPRYPLPSAEAAAAANARALRLLRALGSLGFALFSFRVNGMGPRTAVTLAPSCYELAFVWKGPRALPTRTLAPALGGRGALAASPGKKRVDDAPSEPNGKQRTQRFARDGRRRRAGSEKPSERAAAGV